MVRPALGAGRPGRLSGQVVHAVWIEAMDKPPPSGPGSVQPAARSDHLEQRRKALQSGLRSAEERHAPPAESPSRGQALAMGFRIAVEMLAALLVGGVIGWLLDRWLGTAPFMFLLFIALGAAAGMRNVIQYAYRMNRLVQGLENGGERGSGRSERR